MLLEHGADPNPTKSGDHDSAPLTEAVDYGNLETVRHLLEYGAAASPQFPNIESACHLDPWESPVESTWYLESPIREQMIELAFATRRNQHARPINPRNHSALCRIEKRSIRCTGPVKAWSRFWHRIIERTHGLGNVDEGWLLRCYRWLGDQGE